MIRLPWQDSEETRANKELLAKNLAEKKEKERMKAEQEEQGLPCYQVGVSKDNRVTLRLGSESWYSTLTMTNEGVDRMIRMLEAAKDQCNEEEIEE